MAMWLRLAGAVLVTVLIVSALDALGLRLGWGVRSFEEVQDDLQSRLRDAFWFAVCAFVMFMSVVAALRRWSGMAKRAVVGRSRRPSH